MINGEITFHLQRTLKKGVLLQVKGLIQLIVKFRAAKTLYPFVSYTKHPFQGRKILYTKQLCSNTLKSNKFKVYTISEKIKRSLKC